MIGKVSLREIIGAHRVFLVDNYGVLTRGGKSVPGVDKTFAEIRNQGKRAILLSNTANLSPGNLQNQLGNQGIPFSESDIITSGRVLTPYFAEKGLQGKRMLCLGNEVTADYVRQAGGNVMDNTNIFNRQDEVEAVIVGWLPVVPDGSRFFGPINLEIVNAAINVLRMRNDVRGVIANPDTLVPYGDVHAVLGIGAIGKLIEECAGRILDRLGKPFRPIYDFAFSLIPDVPKEEILMVGDSLEFDILGARNAGIKSLLVMTGNTRSEEEATRSPYKPDYVAPSFILD